MNGSLFHNLKYHWKVWSHPFDWGILLHKESQPSVQSHSSVPFFIPSQQYSWYALHVTNAPFALLHVHSKWLSVHVILGNHTVNPAAHIQSEVFVNHGLVCFVGKYLVHLSFVPQDTPATFVHVAEHVELLVPFLLQSSQASFPFFTPSQHHCWYATQLASNQSFVHDHVKVLGVQLQLKLHGIRLHISHNLSFALNHGVDVSVCWVLLL